MTSNALQTSSINILIIDDEPNNLRVLSTILRDRGYEARAVLTGNMALKAVKFSPPDLILLDIMMPEMDGYEVCKVLKNDASTREIPVIFLSAKDQGIDKAKAFGAGGVDYIAKPFQVEELLARIDNHLRLCRLQRELAGKNFLLESEIRTRKAAEKALQEQNARLQQEIRDRAAAEAALEKSNRELARSNAELERFASVASHDLRSPLATIRAYGELLTLPNSQHLDEKSAHYINRIIAGCDRMLALIDDLLTYSRVGQQRQPFTRINCSQVFEEVCRTMHAEISRNQATIIGGDLPVVTGDRSQLEQLFQNLIGNAIKYRREESPVVKVSAFLENDFYIFSVKDNGLGIKSEHYQKIFQMFNRLHAHDKFPGTGIGLAICQKIVELHGGRIWVESEFGQGSTFYFSLPREGEGLDAGGET